MVEVTVYVEGGGDGPALQTACRNGFSTLFEKVGLNVDMVHVNPCGPRSRAFRDFRIALESARPGQFVCLLVDSEDPVEDNTSPWVFLGARRDDRWERPAGAGDEHAHLMVQCMESWFLADSDALERFFAEGFRPGELPDCSDIEKIPKQEVMNVLAAASRDCVRTGQYRKGRPSFKVLAALDPGKVAEASPYARRLFDTLKHKTQGTEL